MKKIHYAGMMICLLILALGCRKEPINHITMDESRIYITDHDSTVNFAKYQTFYVSDSVAVIKNGKVEKELNKVDSAYIQAVRDQMEQQGYTPVEKDDQPDLGLTVNKIISTQTGVISTGTYWDYYDFYWDPYYWGYPGYGYYLPYAYAVYQINEGALSVDMVDLADAENNKKLNVVWTGLIRGSGIYNADVAALQVQRLFGQSPYLVNQK